MGNADGETAAGSNMGGSLAQTHNGPTQHAFPEGILKQVLGPDATENEAGTETDTGMRTAAEKRDTKIKGEATDAENGGGETGAETKGAATETGAEIGGETTGTGETSKSTTDPDHVRAATTVAEAGSTTAQ
jgi:hypothetical protein